MVRVEGTLEHLLVTGKDSLIITSVNGTVTPLTPQLEQAAAFDGCLLPSPVAERGVAVDLLNNILTLCLCNGTCVQMNSTNCDTLGTFDADLNTSFPPSSSLLQAVPGGAVYTVTSSSNGVKLTRYQEGTTSWQATYEPSSVPASAVSPAGLFIVNDSLYVVSAVEGSTDVLMVLVFEEGNGSATLLYEVCIKLGNGSSAFGLIAPPPLLINQGGEEFVLISLRSEVDGGGRVSALSLAVLDQYCRDTEVSNTSNGAMVRVCMRYLTI